MDEIYSYEQKGEEFAIAVYTYDYQSSRSRYAGLYRTFDGENIHLDDLACRRFTDERKAAKKVKFLTSAFRKNDFTFRVVKYIHEKEKDNGRFQT